MQGYNNYRLVFRCQRSVRSFDHLIDQIIIVIGDAGSQVAGVKQLGNYSSIAN